MVPGSAPDPTGRQQKSKATVGLAARERGRPQPVPNGQIRPGRYRSSVTSSMGSPPFGAVSIGRVRRYLRTMAQVRARCESSKRVNPHGRASAGAPGSG